MLLKVLVVDKYMPNAKFTATSISCSQDHKGYAANMSEEAARIMARERPDVLVLSSTGEEAAKGEWMNLLKEVKENYLETELILLTSTGNTLENPDNRYGVWPTRNTSGGKRGRFYDLLNDICCQKEKEKDNDKNIST